MIVLCAAAAIALSAPARGEEFIYDSQGRRNHFMPYVTPDGRYQKLDADDSSVKKEDFGLKLEGIIYDKYGISYAIVDGTVVKTGDTVGDYVVLTIEEKQVIFMREGQQTIVELKKEGA